MNNFDLLIKNGTIITMDNTLSKKRWMAIKDGIVSATGDHDDFGGNAKQQIDLKGKAVLPGLYDAHVHSTLTGLGQIGIDLNGVSTVNGILDTVAEFCSKDHSDKVVYGYNMTMAKDMVEKRVPNCFELDAVTGDHPIMILFWTVHGGVMNSKAAAYVKSTDAADYVDDNGFFNEDPPMGHIFNLFNDKDFEKLFMNIAKQCASRGITTINSLDGMWVKNDRDTDILMRIRDSLPIDFVPYTQTFDLNKVLKYGLKQIGGCLTIDGSPPQLTAAYSQPYVKAPHTRGFLTYTDKELYDLVTAATKAGVQTSFHAIGDRAIDQIIFIYQQVDREIGIKHLRPRIEHFSYATEQHMEMAVELNVVAVAQTTLANTLDSANGNYFAFQVSEEDSIKHENFARMMKNGVTVAAGSDTPAAVLDSLVGINSAVNAYNPLRRISLDDALRLFTTNAAYACHQEDRKGSLEKGKEADFIIIDRDPYSFANGEDLSTISVEETYRKGKLIFKK